MSTSRVGDVLYALHLLCLTLPGGRPGSPRRRLGGTRGGPGAHGRAREPAGDAASLLPRALPLGARRPVRHALTRRVVDLAHTLVRPAVRRLRAALARLLDRPRALRPALGRYVLV
ncbi:hypothetical protein [Streptomyces varsoviensis]|uniref:hypothetical protein n=1 Tax=Streptomyces varsoviensis TaxID=67373 RepID=UPI0012FEDF8F|nr:hypothetical protein [Streptomyces varsoviensis]